MSGTSSLAGDERLAEAVAAHQAGRLETALGLYRRYLEDRPEDAGAWCLLASAEGQAGNHAGAREAYRRGIEAAPRHAPAHAGLGTASLHLGEPAAAVEHFRRALEIDEELAEARLQLAIALRRLARLPEAIGELESLLARQPEHAQARFNLGMARLEAGRPDRAADAFRQVLASRHGFVPALMGLGRALQAQHRLSEARAVLDEARDAAPGDPGVAVARAGVLTAMGGLAEARREYDRALAADAGNAQALLGLAELDRLEGAPERGVARLRPLLSGSPPGGVFVALARLLRAAGQPEEAARLAGERLAAGRLMPGVHAALLRQLGHARDERGDADGAWEAWTRAHAPRAGRFDPDDFERAIETLIESFPPGLLERAAATTTPDGEPGPAPLLVVGAPRAGKSLLEQMLACHPAVYGTGEQRTLGTLVEEALRRGGSEGYPRCVPALGPDDLSALSRRYRQALAATGGGARFAVDTQPTNFLHVGLAALLHPGLRVVYCRRDPLDLAWACYGRGLVDRAFDFAASPAGIGRYLGALERLIGHWRRLLPEALTTVDYERLVTAPEDRLRALLEWLGLAWDPACAEYHLPGRARLSSPPVLTGPVDAREVGRGRPFAARFPDLPADRAGTDRG